MASEVSICNLALTHIGVNPISALTESKKAAQECNTMYPVCRNLVLRGYRWSFAQKKKALAAIAVPTDYIGPYRFAYVLPADCLKSHEVTESTVLATEPVNAKPKKYELMRAPTEEQILLTDVERPILKYTMRVENPNWFNDEFIMALSLLMGSRLAVPLVKSKALKGTLGQEYLFHLREGGASDANEHTPKEDEEIPWITARTGGV